MFLSIDQQICIQEKYMYVLDEWWPWTDCLMWALKGVENIGKTEHINVHRFTQLAWYEDGHGGEYFSQKYLSFWEMIETTSFDLRITITDWA